MSKEHMENMLDGKILFRNLPYFKKLDDKARGDKNEGSHIDSPSNLVTLTFRQGSTHGNFSFINSLKYPEKVFIFCLSEKYDNTLYKAFNSDVCIQINNAQEFFQLCKCSFNKIRSLKFDKETGLINKKVEYFEYNKRTEGNVKDPCCIPFFKHQSFSNQKEYRLIFGKRWAFKKLQQEIVTRDYRELNQYDGSEKEFLIEDL